MSNPIISLPDELGNLIHLSVLGMEKIQLTEVPAFVTKLSNLTKLGLSGNQLTTILPDIAKLSKLTDLLLQSNLLTSLPPEIGNLSKLEYLHLDENQLTSIPSEIGHLTSLLGLYLSGNLLTTIPSSIESLSQLEHISLNRNVIPKAEVNRLNLALAFVVDRVLTPQRSPSATLPNTPQAPIPIWTTAILASTGTVSLRDLQGRQLWSTSLPTTENMVRAQCASHGEVGMLQIGKNHWRVLRIETLN